MRMIWYKFTKIMEFNSCPSYHRQENVVSLESVLGSLINAMTLKTG